MRSYESQSLRRDSGNHQFDNLTISGVAYVLLVSSLVPFGGTLLVGNTATADNNLDLDVVASHSQFAIVWEP